MSQHDLMHQQMQASASGQKLPGMSQSSFQPIQHRGKANYEPERERIKEEIRKANIKPISEEVKARGLERTKRDLFSRVAGHWSKEEVLSSIDHKIDLYARRHGGGNIEAGRKRLLADRKAKAADGGERAKELAILDKMRKVEEAADAALRTGYREYVDYAVDEVERFTHISKTGAVTAEFDWNSCGDFHDVPALRRSTGQNRVDGPESHLPCQGHGSDDMFAMDFLRDFCARNPHGQPLPEDYTLRRMAIASYDARDPTLFRADNGAVLYGEQPRPPSTDIKLPDIPQGNFRDREWHVDYTLV